MRKALIEQIITLNKSPIEELIATSKLGQVDQLKIKITQFRDYASTLSEVSRLACALTSAATMSAHSEGIQMVQIARKNMEILVPYVINAAQILCVGENSLEGIENMQVIRSRWIKQVALLQLAIDDITSVNDFLGDLRF